MHPHGTAAMLGAGRAVGNATFVEGAGRNAFTPATLPLSLAKAGDLMVVWLGHTVTILGGAASDWNYSVVQTFHRLAWKVLAPADIADTLTLSSTSSESAFAVYRGPLAAAIRGSNQGAHPFNVTGFVKNGWCAGLVAGQYGSNSPGFVSGWTIRASASPGSPSGSYIGDLLNPASYTDNASITFTGSSAGAAVVLELLNY